jgi:beta-glucosidase
MYNKCICIVSMILLATVLPVKSQSKKPTYLDHTQSIKVRVNDLISRMTLEEKVGQLNIFQIRNFKNPDIRRRFVKGEQLESVGPVGGTFALPVLLGTDTKRQAEFLNELQKIAIEETRLKIPLLVFEEGTHGFRAPRGTIFPEGLAIGSTWNMDLVYRLYVVAAREGRAVGAHGLFTLVIEPIRDPRMGRNQEAYSEDPYLTARIAEQIVYGLQGNDISVNDKLIAGLCHYPGQTEAVSGLERGAMNISERHLREIFLPPWEAGIKKAGALGVMTSYPTIDGVPVHTNYKIMTKILREELGFEGVAVSEGEGLGTLVYTHVVATEKEAGSSAINAGVDASITLEPGYLKPMVESVHEGKVSMATIDRSVRRILNLKYKLGLFENPFVDVERAERIVHKKEHVDLTREVAREGIILLKNDNNLLPLKKNIKSIAVIGPKANSPRNQLGDYVAAKGANGSGGCQTDVVQEVVTVLKGIRNAVSKATRVTYVQGCDELPSELNEILQAKKAATEAEVAILVVGERGQGETGDVANLDMLGLQNELVQAVFESGTPTIVILVNGRPLSVRWIAKNVPAVIEAWLIGEQGGNAVADVLFGDYNPSGKLPISIPRHVGQLPIYYNYYPSKTYTMQRYRNRMDYMDMDATPLWEFGFGLSYTKFEYSNLQISPQEIGPSGQVNITVDIQNTGERQGSEVVQLYLNDVISSTVTPDKALRGFEKIFLHPGEKKSVHFTVSPEDFFFYNQRCEKIIEAGTFDVMIGSSSEDIRLKGSFEILD